MTSFADFVGADPHTAWAMRAHRDFVPDECQTRAMTLVREALAAGLFYAADVRDYCATKAGVRVTPATEMHFYYAREAVRHADARAEEKRNAAIVRNMIRAAPRCIVWPDFKRVTGAEVLYENENGTFRVRGKRGRHTLEWDAGATAIVSAINRYATRARA